MRRTGCSSLANGRSTVPSTFTTDTMRSAVTQAVLRLKRNTLLRKRGDSFDSTFFNRDLLLPTMICGSSGCIDVSSHTMVMCDKHVRCARRLAGLTNLSSPFAQPLAMRPPIGSIYGRTAVSSRLSRKTLFWPLQRFTVKFHHCQTAVTSKLSHVPSQVFSKPT